METTSCIDIGIISMEDALSFGFSGYVTWSGIVWDLRKHIPYL